MVENYWSISSVQFSSVVSDSLRPHESQHARPPCPRSLLKSCPSSRWCHSAISSSDSLFFSCPQSFPASGSSQMSQFFTSGDQNTRASASASVLPMCIQGWFSLGLPGLIFLQSKGLLKVLQFESISSLVLSFLYSPILTSIHDYWKNYSFDYMDLCWQSNVSAF